MSEMTLEKVRDWHRRRSDDVRRGLAKGSLIDSDRMANAIDAHIAQHAEMVAKLRELEDMWTQPIVASASFEERVISSARVMCANQLEYRLLSSLAAMTGEPHD